MKRLSSFLILFFILCGFSAFSQKQEQSLLVTDITVLVSNMNVQLTWRRPEGITYSPDVIFRIYRDTKPLTRQTIGPRTLVSEQDASQMIFTEILPDTKEYYYAVIGLTDPDALSYPVVPSVNATVTPAGGTFVSQSNSIFSDITDFNVIAQGNSVIITYISQNKGKKLVLYRSTNPFENFYSLNKAMKVTSFIDTGTPYTDYPPLNIKFYYTLQEESDVITGNVDFKPGKNTSTNPVSVTGTAAETAKSRNLRKAPLPGISSENSAQSGTLAQDTIQMLPGTHDSKAKEEPVSLLPPQIFNEEQTLQTDLSQLLANSFSKSNWSLAEQDLLLFIKNCTEKDKANRAKFYLGEVYYFTGEKRRALLQFLSVREVFPAAASAWIEAVLSL
ncbi:MAG: hypothetical protein J6W46_06635 [Spirochaetaceae bacterium]|nr:hypothetical protein [Spirochaetaceae bacterium]